MSYFPEDIPFMSKEELRENGIRIPKDATDTNVGNNSEIPNSSDLISRQAAIDVVKRLMGDSELSRTVQTGLHILPSAQQEVRPIDYQDCSNAMLKMWIDNVVTDREYNRIMNKLIVHWGKKDG